MKNKLTIMDKRQEITDDEIDRFKNFDALMEKYQQQSNPPDKISWKQWTTLGSVLLIGIIAITYYLNRQEAVPEEITAPVIQLEESVPDEVKNDPEPAKQSPAAKNKKSEKPRVEEQSVIQPDSKESNTNAPIYVQAEPVEGYSKLYEYFSRELIYPTDAIKDSIEGVLSVSFMIGRDGSVAKIEFINTLGKPFEEEAVRLITHMPAWKPATVNGSPVPSKMTLPLTFQIKNSGERKK